MSILNRRTTATGDTFRILAALAPRQKESMMVLARHHEDVSVGEYRMPGSLLLPKDCSALVLLGYAGGLISTRTSAISSILGEAGLGTLTLGFQKDSNGHGRSMMVNIGNLAACLLQATDWIAGRSDLARLRRGIIIGGIGAAAAFRIDGMRPGRVDAIVSYGGRVDLVADELIGRVVAPSLLIVGGDDAELERINRRAMARLTCIRRLEVLPHAHHELEQPGALESASHLAVQWFSRELRPRMMG